MEKPCDTCETKMFCLDISRCLSAVMYENLGETDSYDAEDDELTADKVKLKFSLNNKNVFDQPLTMMFLKLLKPQ